MHETLDHHETVIMKPQHRLVTMKHRPQPRTSLIAARRAVLPVAAAAVALSQFTLAAQNLIQNGSFEDPVVPGDYAGHSTGQTIGSAWLIEHADVDVGVVRTYGVGSAFYPTPAGSQFCYLADGVSFSVLRQDMATPLAAGVTYELRFLQSTFYRNYGQLDGEVTVELSPTGGASELTQVFSLSDYADWTERALVFAPAVSGPYTLRFSSTPGVPGNIDDVRLVESAAVVPEPAACGVAAGLGLLGLAGWRRWR
jgi:hypothetical protein